MPSRYRELKVGGPGGSMTLASGTYVPGDSIDRLYKRMDDTYGNRKGENPMRISIISRNLEPLSGVAKRPSDGSPIATLNGYIPEGLGLTVSLAPTTPDSLHVPRVLAGSNPSRPYVDTGVFLGELRDFPSMGKSIWETAGRLVKGLDRRLSRLERLNMSFKNAAREVFTNPDEHFIATQFGYLPFISDVQKYCNAAQVVTKRAEELRNLKSTGTSSRRVGIDSNYSHTLNPRYRLSSLGVSFYAELVTARSYKRWGVGKWYLQPNGALARVNTDSQMLALTRRAVYGADVDASTAWNLMPWSWLIDWASNAGDWIESSRNTIGASPSGKVCIMTNQIGLWSTRRTPGIHDFYSDVMGGNFDVVNEIKNRTVHSSFDLPQLSIPILSGRQSAILGSLATLRAKGNSTLRL